MIKKFEKFNNSVSRGDFCYFRDELVYINSIEPFGQQYRVEYINKKGLKDSYIADSEDEIEDDFIKTIKSFPLADNIKSKNLIPKSKSSQPSKKVTKDIPRYDVVQYNSKRKVATLDWNLPYKSALGRKKDYENDPKYKKVDIRINKK